MCTAQQHKQHLKPGSQELDLGTASMSPIPSPQAL